MKADLTITKPTDILLVDDVVTSGSTLLGAACRIAKAHPDANIKAFAAMRTISNADEFVSITDPRTGVIKLLDNGKTQRDP